MPSPNSISRYLFARPVVAACGFEFLDVLGRQLRSVDRQREFVNLSGKLERHLVVTIIHRGTGISADVEVLVPLHNQWNGMLHTLSCYFSAIDFEHAGAASTNSTYAIEGKGFDAHTVVFKVEFQRMLARRQCVRALPTRSFVVEEVVQEDWFALEQV